MSIYLVTGNKGKLSEFRRILSAPIESVKLELAEIQAVDVAEVAKAKAQAAYDQLKAPVLVDDTALVIDAWGKLPGALIAWFLDEVGNEGVLKMLAGWEDRSAHVTTAIGYCDQDGVRVFEGTVKGSVAEILRGDNGFGYDPIFVPEGSDLTFAEMSDEQKDRVSMRRLALEEVKKALVLDR